MLCVERYREVLERVGGVGHLFGYCRLIPVYEYELVHRMALRAISRLKRATTFVHYVYLVASLRLRSREPDEGACTTDHHITGMLCVERYREVLAACRWGRPFVRLLQTNTSV